MIKYTTSGFSLVEALVAISLLLFVIVGPMQIVARSFYSTTFSTEKVNAWFLAQEGIELAQKGRDDLVLGNFKDEILGASAEPAPMTTFLTRYANCFLATGCGLSIGNGVASAITVQNCSLISNCRLYLTTSADTDRATYQYTSAGNTVTPFTRVITMQRFPASGQVREILVTSTVTWRTGSLISSQKVEVVSYLFNVYDTN